MSNLNLKVQATTLTSSNKISIFVMKSPQQCKISIGAVSVSGCGPLSQDVRPLSRKLAEAVEEETICCNAKTESKHESEE